ncbi:aldehyde dehydrogenase family protein [Prosthecobacter dejongeii]|uniref:Acyl-CoA reductase-like NAD-dependent aldehyde dehydrogenase n=1 Tax=Prosthecobacter dejongeii TaxID=48465 RepID=A0A7W7YN32_9BACT|nr:aldehyde dehydrogenase family protein [Prosthecobacter dejongeii]MBB5039205.1 acyl-CoA reductase-like NAD-dependent aldehyde dehydrogenase [Prosthecobacter dejongeii]
MSSVPHLPALRKGRPYESLDKVPVKDHKTGEVCAEVSQVNAGIVRKDLGKIGEARKALKKFTVAQLIEITAKAGDLFLNGTLPLGDKGHTQSPEEYIATLSRTSGLPHIMVKRNMAKLHYALTHMDVILNGLSRGLDMTVIDQGFGTQSGCPVAYFPTTDALGLVMPSNSPAVNSLWLPAIALKIPVVIKPGREEPWTPFRLIQAFIAAGAPAEAFGFYPTDHEGSGEVVKLSGRNLVFGDVAMAKMYEGNPRVQVHGPGWSKIIIGEDKIENWKEYIDVIVSSISDNGGRSCINASAVIVPKYGKEIADAIAQRLGPVEPLPADDENARLSGFANTKMADYIDGVIDSDLADKPGAEDVTAKYRNGPRKVEFQGGTFLRPTIIHCNSWDHPLANREFLCPYASVVEVKQSEVLSKIGYSLIVTAITEDPEFTDQLLECPTIDRLNLGPISTMKISWDQPHEGNMFEFLYKRRSIDRA